MAEISPHQGTKSQWIEQLEMITECIGSSTRPENGRAALHVDVGYAPFASDDSVHRPTFLLMEMSNEHLRRNAAIPRGSSLKKVSRNNVPLYSEKEDFLYDADSMFVGGLGTSLSCGPPRLEPSQINKNEESKHVVGNATEVKSRVKKAMALAVERD
ncbi:hypothetical protein L1987_89521 [Smallanthus sonchifolius]|nr:hypothetical protein L1987_89521 [Smallanthus sonchifolius]